MPALYFSSARVLHTAQQTHRWWEQIHRANVNLLSHVCADTFSHIDDKYW